MGPNVHYRVYNNPPLISVLSRLNPFQALPTHFLEIHFNIILPSSPRSSKCSPSFQLPFQNHVMQFTLNLLTYSIKKPRTQLFILREPPPIKRYRPENNRRSVRVPRSSSTDNCRKKLQSLFFFGGGILGVFRGTSKLLYLFILQLLVDPPLGNTAVCLSLLSHTITTWPTHRILHNLLSLIIFGAAY